MKALQTATSEILQSAEFRKFLLRYSNPHTRRAYLSDWNKFIHECSSWFSVNLEIAPPQALSEELITAWMRFSEQHDTLLTTREQLGRAESRNRLLACISSYCTHLTRRKKIKVNPVHLTAKRMKRRNLHSRSEALDEAEIDRLLKTAEGNAEQARKTLQTIGNHKNNGAIRRACASAELTEVIVFTLLTVGMRVSELTSLRICDFIKDGRGHRLAMTLKGGESHDPYIHKVAAEKLSLYIERYRSKKAPFEPLFIRVQATQDKRPLTQYGVYKIVQKIAAQAKIAKPISPHGLRASLATALIRQNIPLAHVKDLLGHQDIQTTNIYVKRARESEESATLLLDTDQLFGKVEKNRE